MENLSRWKTFYDNRKLYIVETTSPTTNTISFVLKINNLGYLINLQKLQTCDSEKNDNENENEPFCTWEGKNIEDAAESCKSSK